LNRLEESIAAWPVAGLPATLADRTRRVYDRMAAVYPVSTLLFHSRAHRCALEASGLSDGMRVLEVATGSGEMFRRLVRANRGGATIGVTNRLKSRGGVNQGARGPAERWLVIDDHHPHRRLTIGPGSGCGT